MSAWPGTAEWLETTAAQAREFLAIEYEAEGRPVKAARIRRDEAGLGAEFRATVKAIRQRDVAIQRALETIVKSRLRDGGDGSAWDAGFSAAQERIVGVLQSLLAEVRL